MDVRSLGLQTDLMVRRLAGSEITDHGDHLVVRTPDNPSFYWGNFVAFPGPPRAGDAARWAALFARHHPDARHRAYAIDDPSGAAGDAAAAAALGVEVDVSVVLTADAPLRPAGATAQVRPVRTDAEWQQLLDVRLSCEHAPQDAASEAFLAGRIAEARRLSGSGAGCWFGAVADGRIVATLGIVADPEYHAIELYRSAGFRDRERQVQLQAAPADS